VGTAQLARLFAREGVTLTAAQQAAVGDVMAGAQSVHAVSGHTIADVPDFAKIVTEAYTTGLQAVLWISAALVILVLLLVLRFVPRRLEAVR
jgi:hypothetical protein